MTDKTEIYLVSTELNGIPAHYGAFENQLDAVAVAEQINLAAGNDKARIESVFLTKKDEHEIMRQRRGFYNEALDWAAGFVINSVDEGDDEKVKEFAANMYRTINANKREL